MYGAGHLLLAAVTVLTAFGSVALAMGLQRERVEWRRWGRGALVVAFLAATVAAAILLFGFLTDDFRLVYVAGRSSRDLAPLYKVAAWWAGQEGSLLFWLWLQLGYAAWLAWRNRHVRWALADAALAILAAISLFFGLLVTWVANPFVTQAPAPPDGLGLNPLLQSPWMAFHPVFLYLGYVGLAVPFAFAMGALWLRQADPEWIRATRQWTLTAWLFLSIGILVGSRWAYEELGWGGYWAWDPVENASFMPWLVATAFLHSVMIQERRGMLRRWNILLVSASYLLTLFGTFLTRSGILSSVHAFVSSDIAPYFVGFIGAVGAGALYLAISRSDLLVDQRSPGSLLSKEGVFLANNILFFALAFAIFWGTVFPLVADALGRPVTLGAPYFNRVTGPLFWVLLVLMGIAPAISWFRATPATLHDTFRLPLLHAGMALVWALVVGVRSLPVLFTVSACAFTVAVTVRELAALVSVRMKARGESAWQALRRAAARQPRRVGGYVVHLGVVLVVLGIMASQYYTEEAMGGLAVGQHLTVGAYQVVFEGFERRLEGGVPALRARVRLESDGRLISYLWPGKRFYPGFIEREGPTTEVAIHSSVWRDVYVVLAGWDDTGRLAGLKVYVNPLVNLIWLGGLILIAGTGIALWPRRHAASTAVATALSALGELEHDYRARRVSPEDYSRWRRELEASALAALAAERAPQSASPHPAPGDQAAPEEPPPASLPVGRG